MSRLAIGTESSADSARPVGQSKRAYFAVITSLGFAVGLLPGLFQYEFQLHVLQSYETQSNAGAALFQWDVAQFVIAFLISPCLFFVIFCLYGKRTSRHFDESYWRVIPLIFLGSALGMAVLVLSEYYVGASVLVPNGGIWFEYELDAFEVVSVGVSAAFVGFAALGLSYLRTRNPLSALK